MPDEKSRTGWGIDNIPYPRGSAQINTRDLQCVGCGICELACAYEHYGILNRELSRIRIHKRMTPVSKSIQTICAQCGAAERKCEQVCPMEPSAIYYNEENHHMAVDTERCIGHSCQKCAKACSGDAIHFFPPDHDYALVCDLCEYNGIRRPKCVDVCPRQALEYMSSRAYPYLNSAQHLWRIGVEEKATLISKRTFPLKLDSLGIKDEPFKQEDDSDG